MKIFRLKAVPGSAPWVPEYDKTHMFIIRAQTEMKARKIASRNHTDEGSLAWIDPNFSSCEEILLDGKAEVISSEYLQA